MRCHVDCTFNSYAEASLRIWLQRCNCIRIWVFSLRAERISTFNEMKIESPAVCTRAITVSARPENGVCGWIFHPVASRVDLVSFVLFSVRRSTRTWENDDHVNSMKTIWPKSRGLLCLQTFCYTCWKSRGRTDGHLYVYGYKCFFFLFEYTTVTSRTDAQK